MARRPGRKRQLLNSEVDKYMKERQLVLAAWSESKAPELAKQLLNGELPKQFIPQLKFRKQLKDESEEDYEEAKAQFFNELEVYKAKYAFVGFKFMMDKVIQLLPKQHSVQGKVDHEHNIADMISDAAETYIPEDASEATLKQIENRAMGDCIDVDYLVREGETALSEGGLLDDEQLTAKLND